MTNYTKGDEISAEIAKMLDAGFSPPIDLPRCHCGALAAVGAYTRRGVFYFCGEHEKEAKALI
jgi:hypothetical protein